MQGSMASIGEWKGVYDGSHLGQSSDISRPPLRGFIAFILWRAAYWTRQVSFTNKILIPMFWFKSAIFGRDVSRF
jgi:NADH dehydrogenase FAD-containing subunit